MRLVLHNWVKSACVLAAAAVMGSSLYVAARRSAADLTMVFHDAPATVVPAGLLARVEFVKTRVPKGSLIVYFMDRPEVWEFGLWKRSLYPDYLVLPATDRWLLQSAPFQALRYRYNARYVLLAGASLPGLRDAVALPDYPGGQPMSLATLEN